MAGIVKGMGEKRKTIRGYDMTNIKESLQFVIYFSTAQDNYGHVYINANGTEKADLLGGTPVAPGLYEIEDGNLKQIEENTAV